MARKNNHSLYIILALLLCVLLLSPYLGIFSFFASGGESSSPSAPARTPITERGIERDSEIYRENQRQRQDDQKKKLSEIEQLLD